jgi:hypothetical protein
VRYRTAESHTGGQRYAVRILSPGLAVVPRGTVPHRAVRTAGVAVPLPQEMPNTERRINNYQTKDNCQFFVDRNWIFDIDFNTMP